MVAAIAELVDQAPDRVLAIGRVSPAGFRWVTDPCLAAGRRVRPLPEDAAGRRRCAPITVPILIGADGPKGLAVAAELGDGVFSAMVPQSDAVKVPSRRCCPSARCSMKARS